MDVELPLLISALLELAKSLNVELNDLIIMSSISTNKMVMFCEGIFDSGEDWEHGGTPFEYTFREYERE